VITVIAGYSLWVYHRSRRLEATFYSFPAGASKASLIHELGVPWKDAKCGETFGGDMPLGCVNEIIYGSPLAPLVPEYFAFLFDANGRLVGKAPYSSP
jgi:hypothetical protein